MAGHLFGYEAALAIDAQAIPLREARVAVESVLSAGVGVDALDRLGPGVEGPATRFFNGLRSGAYDGHLEASTAVRMSSLLRYAIGISPLELYQVEYGKVGTPGAVIEDLTAALAEGVEQLTRPIDAIKHQAKTVTVGISRADESLLRAGLVREVLGAGAARDRLSYRALRTLAELDPAVGEVRGYTRYRIEGDPADGTATIQVVDKGGIARDIPSRSEHPTALAGSKRRAATERQVTVARGLRDRRTVIFVPEVKDNQATGLTLLQVSFHDRLPAETIRSVLQGYRDRYAALRDAVTETEPTFRDDLLADVPVVDLLTEPVHVLAAKWRASQ
jgi:glucosamine--fructose-6-phosphate aminotransferase (isomerizing)